MNLLSELTDALEGKRGKNNKLIAEEGLKWIITLLNKNTNYGDSVFKKPILAPDCESDSAIRVRMSDKVSRINTLLIGDRDRVGESLSDTFSDLGSYCLLWLVNARINDNDNCIVNIKCPKCTQSDALRIEKYGEWYITTCSYCIFEYRSDAQGVPLNHWRCTCGSFDNTSYPMNLTVQCSKCDKTFDERDIVCPNCKVYGPLVEYEFGQYICKNCGVITVREKEDV